MYKKTLLIILFITLIFNFVAKGQLDSSVTYIDSIPKYMAVWDGTTSLFYKKNQTENDSVWTLYGMWEDTENTRYYYNPDSTGELKLNYKEIWDNDIKYSYYIDEHDSTFLVSYTIYYGTYPERLVTTPDNNVNESSIQLYVNQDIITITASEIINDIKIYNVEGQLIYYFKNPNVSMLKIITHDKGLLIFKIKYNNYQYLIKKIVISYNY
jgi:hypothetical protein